jgi:GNAT superfamily N-acetyltransferase
VGLDDLYGAGAAVEFAGLVDLTSVVPGAVPAITEQEGLSKYGTVGVLVLWTDPATGEPFCQLQLDFHATFANYVGLAVADGYRGKGIYQALILQQPAWLAMKGVAALVASPLDERAEWILELGGFHWQQFEGVERFAALTAGDRMTEYRAWLEAGRPEESQPEWRAEVIASRPRGEAEY